MAALVRSRCRIITTPMTTSSRPAMATQARCCSSWSRARMKWKIPPRIRRAPMNTHTTLREVDGWKANASPRASVTTPTRSSTCHTTLLGTPPSSTTTSGSDGIAAPFASDDQPRDTVPVHRTPLGDVGGPGAGRSVQPPAATTSTEAGVPGPQSWWYACSGSGGMRRPVLATAWNMLEKKVDTVNGRSGPYSDVGDRGAGQARPGPTPSRRRGCARYGRDERGELRRSVVLEAPELRCGATWRRQEGGDPRSG